MAAKFISETSVGFQRTTRRYIPEDRTLHKHYCENLKSYKYEYGAVSVSGFPRKFLSELD
jgi:hypothetical protein